MASLLKNRSLLVNLTIGAAAVALGLVVYQQKKKADARKVSVSAALLQQQDSKTSQAVLEALKHSADFRKLSKSEMEDTISRDQLDDEKLAAGIKLAVDRGVLTANPGNGAYKPIDVYGKSVEQVTDEIIGELKGAEKTGCVVVLVGLSGTGKGTTMARLAKMLPNATTWSNGNVFRSLTLLAATWCEKAGLDGFDEAKALTAANLKNFMTMLTFDFYSPPLSSTPKFDIRIQSKDLGIDSMVSDIQNTTLKGPKVGKNIPLVANKTQGEVVNFVNIATGKMSAKGMNVLIEGREATVDHIATPHRFALTLSDPIIIGQRRASQRIMAAALKALGDSAAAATPLEVNAALVSELEKIAAE
mmetsp:Transcript_20650/g.47868  ORF Transcript_20650/g.47868 Transcript_20650/m.47868 type:complete len:360 (-) Transcript_20650:113-1192(-)|eukprot:CAMPEP_0119491094 /NCGR_PEP_ID=MMETSP1344-20130328/16083_1 /TAXON_ID=236787 /ORGANISM="Florenciella parvula, Strain CCMP2471" /LENGTH=359 /DNA_ID=CAMNT_0007526323 /DNA_START=56 /DNA_END=1135 /DNA_ORIENTATION=-